MSYPKAENIIVIHPGSLNLRIGRASDLHPLCILHGIARRNRSGTSFHRDSLLPVLQPVPTAEFEQQRMQVNHAIKVLQQQHRDERPAKRLRLSTPSANQISSFNRRTVPLEEVYEGTKPTPEDFSTRNTLFDRDILRLSATDALAYNVHFPMRRGELNMHSAGVGGSMEAVLSHMEAIWLHAISALGIAPARLPLQYSAVLVTADIYNRSHLRELVTLLLQRLRFRSCFLLQDHVASTFGAGLGYACVVDVGDQKCSISCVEDGISQPNTRVRLSYGSGDVTQIFHSMLRKSNFPYKDCNEASNYADGALLMRLKEQSCHIKLDTVVPQERSFEVRKPGRRLIYTMQLGLEDCVVPPLALFHSELLNITGRHRQAHVQLSSSQQPDSEDCFDADYIRETGRRNGRDQLLEGTMPVTGEAAEDDPQTELTAVDAYDALYRDGNAKVSDKEESPSYMTGNGQIVPLDQAIIRSIERCPNEEMKRKMYGCILLVGEGVKVPGFGAYLEKRIRQQLASGTIYHRTAEQLHIFEVNACMKDMDAALIAWKGAAIMSCLESSPELWLHSAEWEKYGLRILREKAPFIW